MDRKIKSVVLTIQNDPEVIGLVNEFASVHALKPHTALKRHILRTFPNLIKKERASQHKSARGVA